MIKSMLKEEKNIDWERDFATHYKRGSCCIKNINNEWIIDTSIPIFKGEGREYIERLIQEED